MQGHFSYSYASLTPPWLKTRNWIKKKKIKAKTCFKRKREFFWLQLEHHKERYYFLTHIQTDYEKIEKPIDFGDIAKVKDVI